MMTGDYTIHHDDGGNYAAHSDCFSSLLPFRRARGSCTHLFLNPNDVKGFSFKLQLTDIRPAETHNVMTLIKNMHMVRVKIDESHSKTFRRGMGD